MKRAREVCHDAGKDSSAGRSHLTVASELWESLLGYLAVSAVSAEIVDAGGLEVERVGIGQLMPMQGSLGGIG